jgi:hypothetical protein
MGNLYSKSTFSLVNDTRQSTSTSRLTSDTPYTFVNKTPEKAVVFVNGKAKTSVNEGILRALKYISETNIPGTDLSSISTGKISPIFLGSPDNPDSLFLYSNPMPETFYSEYKTDECEQVFLFAHITQRRNRRAINNITGFGDGGFVSVSPQELSIPYSTPNVFPSKLGGLQTISIDQGNTGGAAPIIRFSSLSLDVQGSNTNNGESVIFNNLDIDTWYKKIVYDENGNEKVIGNGWDNNSDLYNVGVGAGNVVDISGNRIFSPAERYSWSFGTIYYFRGIGPGSVFSKYNNNKDLRFIDNGINTVINTIVNEIDGVTSIDYYKQFVSCNILEDLNPNPQKPDIIYGNYTQTNWGGIIPEWVYKGIYGVSTCTSGIEEYAKNTILPSWDYEGITNSEFMFMGYGNKINEIKTWTWSITSNQAIFSDPTYVPTGLPASHLFASGNFPYKNNNYEKILFSENVINWINENTIQYNVYLSNNSSGYSTKSNDGFYIFNPQETNVDWVVENISVKYPSQGVGMSYSNTNGFINRYNSELWTNFGIQSNGKNWDETSEIIPVFGHNTFISSNDDVEDITPETISINVHNLGVKYDYSNKNQIHISTYKYGADSCCSGGNVYKNNTLNFPLLSLMASEYVYENDNGQDVYGRCVFKFLFKAIIGGECIDVVNSSDGKSIIINWNPFKNLEKCINPSNIMGWDDD